MSRPHACARRAGVACGAATLENEFAVQEDELEDFYQLLGVVRRPHCASPTLLTLLVIKR
jgi:hypothetical protein